MGKWEERIFDDLKESNLIGLVRNTKQQSFEFEFDYLKMNNITNDGELYLNSIVKVNASKDELKKYTLKKGDFLFNTRNSVELVGKTAVYDVRSPKPMLFNNNIMRSRFKKDFNPYFINYQFQSSEFKERLEKIKSGTTNVAAIYYKSLKDIMLKFPPIAEQQRIVAKLDALFVEIDDAICLLKENIAHTRALMGSVLDEEFGKLEKLSSKKEKLKNITTKIGSGSTPRGGQKSYKSSGISLIRSMNVHDCFFKDKNLAFIDDEQADKLKNVEIQENDVLLNITGASVARCCIVDSSYLPARVNQHVSIIRTDESILPEFMLYFLVSPKMKSKLLYDSAGNATREAITKSMIEFIELPIVSIEIQQHLVDKIKESFRLCDELTKTETQKMSHLKSLKSSLLDQAFKGEL
ncbi:restriction endonuclease subunit S [Gillisia sp. JM1]|uniref:restriction endonuclease subunit S n=1 Tax=Gillisia sp. JM1 TaxID=1283286 RepID=UPI0004258E01|nr:restriction endonuclease subunit S [Gillisia sp. JM1]